LSTSVALLDERRGPALTRFLDARPDATVFHSSAWANVIRAAYRHEVRCWIATEGDDIVGAFPVTVMRVPGLGRKFVAGPYQMHSGMPLADNASVRSELLAACVAAARKEAARYVEVRHFEETDELAPHGFVRCESGLVTTTIPLANLALTQAEHGHRQRVRKADKLGVEIVRSDRAEDLRLFRRMYLQTGRAMGAPQSGWPYFAATLQLMPNQLALYLAKHEGRVVGGFLVLGDRRLAFARCSAHSSRESLAVNAGQALWWRALQDAAAAGCPGFHCGVSWSGDVGLIKWKEGWGGTSRPVQTFVLPIRARAPEAGGYFEGYGLAKALWKRLPMPIADVVGHQVTRWIA
jgi:hypothetical protein